MGRPKLDVDIEDIIALKALNYGWTKIALILGISRSTLYRRLNEEGISSDSYTELTSAELDEVVIDIKRDHPNDGEVLVNGHLLRLGIRVTRAKLRASIHHVDHDNTVARRSHTVKRRVYAVSCPNALWHVDTHHKLIRWRFVIHAGIDGFSRTIVYAKCADNNRAVTSVGAFVEGVDTFGLPHQVRSDHGGENVDIWRYMLSTHSNDTSCILTGSSTHNERVERLWRDVNRCVCAPFADTFHTLEAEGILDPLNEADMFCLHYIFLPRIAKSLKEFQESWNNHPLSTEGNLTPYQLFFEGTNIMLNDGDTDIDLTSPSVNTPTVNPTTFDPECLSPEHVAVPRILFSPCSVLVQLFNRIDPLSLCNDNGRLLYQQAIQTLGQHVTAGCGSCV